MLVTWLKIGDLRCSNNSLVFLRIHVWFIPLQESCSTSEDLAFQICVSRFVRRMDRALEEHFDEPVMILCLYWLLCIFESNICMANQAHLHLSLFKIKWGPNNGCLALLLQNNPWDCMHGSQGVSLVQVPMSRCWRNVSRRQMYSCWIFCLRGLWKKILVETGKFSASWTRVGTSLLFKLPLCASLNTRLTGRVNFWL